MIADKAGQITVPHRRRPRYVVSPVTEFVQFQNGLVSGGKTVL